MICRVKSDQRRVEDDGATESKTLENHANEVVYDKTRKH